MIIRTFHADRSPRVVLHVGWRFFWHWRDYAAAAYKRYDHGKVTVGPFTLEEW